MAEKELLHKGFYIPNAGDVSNPRMAEPDRVDFNTLAHPLWGVIDNCEVMVVGSQAQTPGGTVLVDGKLLTMPPRSAGIRAAGAQDRFDLVVSDAGGILKVIEGTPAVDPVFPDVPRDNTVLAAVFCPAGEAILSANVIDKRKFVSKALLTKIAPTSPLVQNTNNTGNHFLLDGGGRSVWEGDTWMWRSSPETLSVHKNLVLEGTLTTQGNAVVIGDVNAGGNVTGANLHRADTAPEITAGPATIWQDSATGRVFVRRNGAWEELATISSAIPVGTVITSLEKPSVMKDLGWIPLDGTVVYEDAYPKLFQVQGLAYLIQEGSGTPPGPRSMTLPDARKRMLLTDFDLPAGSMRSPNPGNKVTLKTGNMPRHGHNPRTDPAGSASPQVTITRSGEHVHKVQGDGEHVHDVQDDMHRHEGMDYGGYGAPVIALKWEGQNKIDAMFNDRNHTFSVDAYQWTVAARSNVQVLAGKSKHYHSLDHAGDHDHTATVAWIPDHTHKMAEDNVGNNESFDITPDYLVVYSYVRT